MPTPFRYVLTLVLLGALFTFAGCDRGRLPARDAPEQPRTGEVPVGAAGNWPHHGGGVDESNFSQLDEINLDSISRLGLAWSLDLPGEVTLEATPLAIDGVLYFSGTYSRVYAVDARSGEILWHYDPEIWKHGAERLRLQFAASRGVAYAQGKIFAATFDGRLLALDASTGELLWSTKTVPPDSYYFITGAPRVFNDKVIIGNGGGDFGSRGYVTAYAQATGDMAWRFYVVPGSPEENRGDPVMEMAAETWTGEYWQTGTGGTAWHGITFDPELNQVYIGTGNGGPSDPSRRSPEGGDNLFLVSIVALDADSGEYRWHYQQNPREAWDYKATADMVSASLVIDDEPRKVLMQAPVNGFFYVIDRVTGRLISAEKFTKVTWAERIDLATGRPVEAPNIRSETEELQLWPSPAGAHNWQAMAYSPRTGLAYIPSMQAGVKYSRGETRKGEIPIAGLNIGWIEEDPEDGTASLLAWDPVTQTRAWKTPLDSFWNGGVLATAGDLVFQATASGYLYAYNARSGERVWGFDTHLGVIAAPMSYLVDGEQYISLLVGYGGSASAGGQLMNEGWQYGAQPRRLLTFKLDGEARLPATAPADRAVRALDDASMQLDEDAIQAGARVYVENFCIVCHGRDLLSAGTAPDLRGSAIALDRDSFWSVVYGGRLLERGMPRFEHLTRRQAEQLRQYIRAGAREALGAGGTPAGGGAPH